MSKKITNKNLERLLEDLGFTLHRVNGSHKVFKLPSKDVLIVLPFTRSTELVKSYHLVAVKKALIEKGVLDYDSFESRLNRY